MASHQSTNNNVPAPSSVGSCPIMKLPPELRLMIYDYYLEDTLPPKLPPNPTKGLTYDHPYSPLRTKGAVDAAKDITTTQRLKPYFGLLHHSSGVRAEHVLSVYRSCFTGVRLRLYIDTQQSMSNFKRAKDMCSLIRDVDKDIPFGLRFILRGCSRVVFLEFVESFYDMLEKEDRGKSKFMLRVPYLDATSPTKHKSRQGTAIIMYCYWSFTGEFHELRMFGTLARLDWSKFNFEFPAP